jgi:hypothetical protein
MSISDLPKALSNITDYQGSSTNSLGEALLPTPNLSSLKNMTRKQYRLLGTALFFGGAHKVTEVCKEIARLSFATLAGLQLSGFLEYNVQTSFKVKLDGKVRASSDDDYSMHIDQKTQVQGPEIPLKEIINRFLIIPIDTMTYISAGAWATTHTFAPLIQRFLTAKKDQYIEQFLQELADPSKQPSTPPSQWAKVVDHLIEYAQPVLFDASRIALFIRFLRQVENHLDTNGGVSSPIHFDNGLFSSDIILAVSRATTTLIPGEDPVSTTILYLFLVMGIISYAVQALANFSHDIQTQKQKVQIGDQNVSNRFSISSL